MNINPKFELVNRNPDPFVPASIRLKLYFNKQRLVFGIGKSIYPELWSDEDMGPVKDRRLIRKYEKVNPHIAAELEILSSRISKVRGAVSNHFLLHKDRTKEISVDEVRDVLLQKIKPEVAQQQPKSLSEYIDYFIKQIETGKRTTDKGTKYGKTTINAYRSFQNRFQKFTEHLGKDISFDDITLDFYEDFVAYLSGLGKRPNTIGKEIKTLKAIMRASLDDKIHSNTEFQRRKFKTIREEVEEIYLTAQELDKMAALDLSAEPHMEVARDVFLIGCHSAQRFSDYSRITRENESKTAKGSPVIDLTQKKTGRRVIIPIRPALQDLLDKYDWQVPHIFEQKLNKRIKVIGEKAGIKSLVPVVEFKNGKRIHKKAPKYTQIKSHTARRTGATLMHLAGVPLVDICKITGHTQVKSLMRYLRISEEEVADKLSLHPYFAKQSLRKVK